MLEDTGYKVVANDSTTITLQQANISWLQAGVGARGGNDVNYPSKPPYVRSAWDFRQHSEGTARFTTSIRHRDDVQKLFNSQ